MHGTIRDTVAELQAFHGGPGGERDSIRWSGIVLRETACPSRSVTMFHVTHTLAECAVQRGNVKDLASVCRNMP
jgi:hypothetical protein